jgi:hypothetical protein
VKRCREGFGLGLFAAEEIQRGQVVARMHTPRVVRDPRWRAAHLRGDPGADAAIETSAGELITSAGFGEFSARDGYARAPKWYRMNHHDQPNTRPRAHEGGLEWRALRTIPRGEALTWHYGKRDSTWSRRPFCTVPA